MQGPARKVQLLAFIGVFVAGCVSAPPPQPPTPPANAGVYKVGNPYQVNGVWYYPSEQPDYDETGIASWYGPNFHGKLTANGEVFDSSQLSAAHQTLPMPVNVRVTNLENGRSLVLRVNDRGPFVAGRILDVSERGAELLGFRARGTARVRVTFVGRADLPDGSPQPFGAGTSQDIVEAARPAPLARVESSELPPIAGARVSAVAPPASLPQPEAAPVASSAKPSGTVTQMEVSTATRLYVQVGAFSDYQNASRLVARLGGDLRISPVQRGGVTLYRVRIGPFYALDEADAALAQMTRAGSGDAKIVVDQ